MEKRVIAGIGIDTVIIRRFDNWATFSHARLQKIFTPEEIDYCTRNPHKISERFAARFAAREAFYKAISSVRLRNIPFFTLSKNISVCRKNSDPQLKVDWPFFIVNEYIRLHTYVTHISITHTKNEATSFIILEASCFSSSQ